MIFFLLKELFVYIRVLKSFKYLQILSFLLLLC